MDITEIIERAGGCVKLAAAVNKSHSTILKWKQVPAFHVIKVSDATGIAPHELRPDVFPVPSTHAQP